MNSCSKMEEAVVAFARGKRLNPLTAQRLRTHTASCMECQGKLANERALSMALSVLASECTEAPSPLLEDVLRDAFRRESAQKAASTKKPRLVAGVGIAAAAAVLLAVAWIATQTTGKPIIDSQPKLAAQGRSDQILRASSSTSSRDPLAVHAEAAVKADRQPAHKPQPHTGALQRSEETTDFMRIAYTDPVLPTEQVDIVRVQMREAALAMFGLPVDGSHLDSKIYADVVVGQDGFPRAIRFIR